MYLIRIHLYLIFDEAKSNVYVAFKPILKIRRKKSKKGKIIVLFLLDNTRMDEIARSSSQLSIGIIGNNCEGIIIRFKLIFK